MKTRLSSLSFAVLLCALISCGGGGDSGSTLTTAQTTVSGVAAAGMPIIGYAYLRDKNGKDAGPVAINPGGNFSFQLDDTYVPPFVLKADGAAGGQHYALYSATQDYGTANINPFTNLALAKATGTNPATVYSAVNANSAVLTTAALQSAINDIRTMLHPLLTANNITDFNPLSETYTANGRGLDAVLDVVRVEVNGTSVSLINKTDGTTISTSNTLSTLPSAVSSGTAAQLTSTMTDLTAIGQLISNWAAALNKGDKLQTADLEPLYVGNSKGPDVYGYNNGYERAQEIDRYVNEINQMALLGGLSAVKNLSLVKKISPLYNTKTRANSPLTEIYQIRAEFYLTDNSFGTPDGAMLVAKENGQWRFIGNQWLVRYKGRSTAHKWDKTDGTTLIKTGLALNIKDVGGRGVNSARIEGPGITQGGITFSKTQQSVNGLILDVQYPVPTMTWEFVPLDDATINNLSEAEGAYTVTLFSDAIAPANNNQFVQQFTATLNRKPVLNSDLSTSNADYFPAITMTGLNHTMAFASTNIFGKTVTLGLTKPHAYTISWIDAEIDFWNNATQAANRMETIVPLYDTSITITYPNPTSGPTDGEIMVWLYDQYQRQFVSHYLFH